MASGTGLGPFNWVGQNGGKWSFTLLHRGHIIQLAAVLDFVFGVGVVGERV